ncbi:MAG: hypothetical protein E7667_03935 [Ruminococcaceae bacterium]|nr:hypothetical protein [Oscillospiraceae bacterium]
MDKNNQVTQLSREELKEIVKKRKKKKALIVSLVAIGVMLTAVTAGLLIWNAVRLKPIKRTEEQARVVGQVGEYDIYYDEFSYLVGIHRSDIENKYGEVDWNGDSEASKKAVNELTAAVLRDIEQIYVVLELCEEHGIKTDERKINKQVNEKIQSVIDTSFGGERDGYYDWLEKNNLSDAYYRLVCKMNILEEQLLEKLISDGDYIKYNIDNRVDFSKYVSENDEAMCSVHIYYPKIYKKYTRNEDGQIVSYMADVSAQTKAEAAEALTEIRAAKNNDERMEIFNKFVGNKYMVEGITMETTDPIYFWEGLMDDEYEDAAEELGEYQVSDVVETEDGYYIIMCMPKNTDYIKANADTLLSRYQGAKLLSLENKMAEKLSFKCSDISALIVKELTK